MSLSNAVRLLSLAALLALFPLLATGSSDEDADVEPPGGKLTNSIGMKFVRIPRGKLSMGASKDDNTAREHEKPLHEVEISKDYYLGVYEVTQKQYKEVMGKTPSSFSRNGRDSGKVKDIKDEDLADFPVENVSWDDAQTFLKKLSDLPAEKKANRVYRLPTEAEWERACRGKAAKSSLFHFGDALASKQANFDGTRPGGNGQKGDSLGRTCKVGSYRPNNFGLFDMHGNVWEWCQDEWDAGYYAKSPQKDPPGPGGRSIKVHRGGCYNAPGFECRSSHRTCSSMGVKDGRFGFRAAMTIRRD